MSITTLEYRVIRVDCGGDSFGTSDVRRSFEIVLAGQSKSIKTGPLFVGVMRLVTGLSEWKERLQRRNVAMVHVIIWIHFHN